MPPKSISWQHATQQRLAKQFLLKPAFPSQISQVAAALCGVQAQVLSGAELALAARVKNLTHSKLSTMIWDQRQLVKTYGPRGTLHLLPADELPLWMAAMRARESQDVKAHHVGGGFTSEQAHAVKAAIGKALDGRQLSRDELAKAVARQAGSWALGAMQSSWGYLFGPAAYEGFLCFAPSEGAKVNFVRADQWIKDWKHLDEDESLREVARRYIGTYGPVRPQDFARWFWLSKETCDRVFGELAPELQQVDFEGRQYWILKSRSKPIASKGHSLFLLPYYDTYTLGCVPRERLMQEPARARVSTYRRGRFEGAVGLSVLLIDGQVAGIWERKHSAKAVSIKVEAFGKLSATQKHLVETEAQRIGDFFETESKLSFGKLN